MPETRSAIETWRKPLLVGLTAALLLVAGAIAWVRWQATVERGLVGIDLETYTAFGRRFIETGSQYLPYQLLGSYTDRPVIESELIPSAYPPTALALFIPLQVLPAFLWWAIPLGILGARFAAWRPAVAAWPLIAACVVWPETTTTVMVGSSTMWVVALTALGLRYGWPVAFVLFKPSLAFVAVVGVRRPSFWLLTGLILVGSLVLLPEWVRWFIAIRNGAVPVTYSLGSVPAVAIPILAWLARSSPGPARARSEPERAPGPASESAAHAALTGAP
jgi:hypothetical protein